MIGVLDTGHMIFAFYRNSNDNKVYLYNNILSSTCVEDGDILYMDKETDIDYDDVDVFYVNYDMFLSFCRDSIIDCLQNAYDNPEQNETLFSIREEIAKDGGKIVSFNDDECGLLLGAAATDEDLYYWFVDGDYKIKRMTAVSGYKVLDKAPLKLRKFKKLKPKDALHIKNIMQVGLMTNAEVFFTSISLPLSETDLTIFKRYSFLYLPK